MISKSPAAPKPATPAGGSMSWLGVIIRCAITVLLVGGYYSFREPLAELFGSWYSRATGQALDPANRWPFIVGVVLMLIGLIAVWWRLLKTDPRFQAPLLITSILLVGDAAFNVLENQSAPPWLVQLTGGRLTEYSPTFVAIVFTILAEMLLGRFFWGKLPHLASAYISGISVGILIKSPDLWPFILCGLISITSKYVLRIGSRHLWNPTNFGVTMMLFLAPASVASLSVQAGNNGWAVAVIWLLGGITMYRLGLWHIPLTFVAAFVPLAIWRSYALDIMEPQATHGWLTEVAPITSPMFQLYIFFMITDPKTITRGRKKQVIVVLIIAAMETFLRLAFKDIYSLFHALFIVGPVANIIEVYADRRKKQAAALSISATAPTPPSATAEPRITAEIPGVLARSDRT
jgi:enediyne biosynthesis protein E5